MELLINYFIKNILWIFVIIIILGKFFYPKIIGKAGEYWVKKELKKLPKDNYKILNDVMLYSNGLYHQIDHIVISKYGIFVIETKKYNGYISGNEYDKKWIQNNKYYINNPIHQNYGHVKCLEEILNLSIDKFIPIVCIPSPVKLRITSKNYVLRLYELNNTILSYKNIVIENQDYIYNKLNSLNIIDKKKRKEHIKNTKEIIKNNNQDSLNKCPKCGSKLVYRKSKYGVFIGCSNYPKCKYKKNK